MNHDELIMTHDIWKVNRFSSLKFLKNDYKICDKPGEFFLAEHIIEIWKNPQTIRYDVSVRVLEIRSFSRQGFED